MPSRFEIQNLNDVAGVRAVHRVAAAAGGGHGKRTSFHCASGVRRGTVGAAFFRVRKLSEEKTPLRQSDDGEDAIASRRGSGRHRDSHQGEYSIAAVVGVGGEYPIAARLGAMDGGDIEVSGKLSTAERTAVAAAVTSVGVSPLSLSDEEDDGENESADPCEEEEGHAMHSGGRVGHRRHLRRRRSGMLRVGLQRSSQRNAVVVDEKKDGQDVAGSAAMRRHDGGLLLGQVAHVATCLLGDCGSSVAIPAAACDILQGAAAARSDRHVRVVSMGVGGDVQEQHV
ncbi:hypothetical protein CBR_g48452 [Chara braunii]|uniref:Uncharacterized protein n=1 Tax=Chara braunii TaxID=69332 RepID=A0A388M2N6_CHABU|nr:hypothetical protein CBR_g48452 [Chara braunii]|eukprot:GBG88840.1 hypothetical protein CBR_g48452 [Chara braunii]